MRHEGETTKLRTKIGLGLGLICVAAACATVASQSLEFEATDDAELHDEPIVEPEPEAALEPLTYPDPPGYARWLMPDYGVKTPDFPYLPGEDESVSRSIGTVSTGYLINSISIPSPHPHMATLPVQYSRGLRYTSDRMLDLVASAARHVDSEFPGTVVWLGNFGAQGGGDIPYSVSHNSGRDADISFFVHDENAEPFSHHDLIDFEEDGTWVHPDTDHVYFFDVARNWAFVQGLLEHDDHRLQYIFISNGLRSLLLDHARETRVEPRIRALAAKLLVQPGGALPHNDHFHLRIYCDEDDVRSGCINTGRRQPTFESFASARRDTVRLAESSLSSEDEAERLAAVRRLHLMQARESLERVADLVDDSSSRVRAAVARNLAELGSRRHLRTLADRLDVESSDRVRVELVDSLARAGGRVAVRALTQLLATSQPMTLPDDSQVDARGLVADALVRLEDEEPIEALIALLQDDDPTVVERARESLAYLTNQRLLIEGGQVSEHDAWREWFDENSRLGRDRWLVEGFQAAGFEVEGLDYANVWDLCRAVLGPDYISYNAQRVLMRLSGREPPSLEWSQEDANFYWRRWFERRCDRLGCPAVPEGMSTLTDED